MGIGHDGVMHERACDLARLGVELTRDGEFMHAKRVYSAALEIVSELYDVFWSEGWTRADVLSALGAAWHHGDTKRLVAYLEE